MAFTDSIGDSMTHLEYWPAIAETITLEANLVWHLNMHKVVGSGYHGLQEQIINYDQAGFINCASTVTSVTMTPTENDIKLAFQAMATEICDRAHIYSDFTDAYESQITALLRYAGRQMEWQVINGNGTYSSTETPVGLKTWLANGYGNNTIANAGATLTSYAVLNNLDTLISLAKVRPGRVTNSDQANPNAVFVAHPFILNMIKHCIRKVNGFEAAAHYKILNGFAYLTYNEFACIPTEMAELNDNGTANTGSVYFVNLEFPTNGFGLIGHEPNPNLRGSVMTAGPFQILDKPSAANKPSQSYQIQANWNAVLGSPIAASRITGLPTALPTT